MRTHIPLTLACSLACLLPSTLMAETATDAETTDKSASSADARNAEAAELEKLSKMSANPLGAAWMLWFQNDYTHYDGDNDNIPSDGRWANSTKFQPVMSFPYDVGEDEWNFIVRPVLQYQSMPLDDSFDNALVGNPEKIPASEFTKNNYPYTGRTTGFGDTALMTITGPARDDGFVWGAGITQIFPTAEEDVLGQGKYQAGPALLLTSLAPNPGGWNLGILAQHWWSYAGDDDRESTNQTDIQYFMNYRWSATELVGMTPNIKINWEADSGQKVNFPIGLGYSNVIKLGSQPVRIVTEVQYSVVKGDDYDADWNLRFMFIPIVENPFRGY